MMTSFDNNKDKVFSLLKYDFGESRVRSRARLRVRSNNHRFCDHGITIAFFFGVSSDKQVIVISYLQLSKKPLNLIG